MLEIPETVELEVQFNETLAGVVANVTLFFIYS